MWRRRREIRALPDSPDDHKPPYACQWPQSLHPFRTETTPNGEKQRFYLCGHLPGGEEFGVYVRA